MNELATHAGVNRNPLFRWWFGGRDRILGEVEAARYVPEFPVDQLAYVLLRAAEAFVYSPIITGEEPDSEKVRPLLRRPALLGVPSHFLPAGVRGA